MILKRTMSVVRKLSPPDSLVGRSVCSKRLALPCPDATLSSIRRPRPRPMSAGGYASHVLRVTAGSHRFGIGELA